MTITIATAVAGIDAATKHLSEVGKASMTQTKTAKNLNSITKLKKRSAKIDKQLKQAVQPLNDRLKPMGMLVWWDGEEYVINAEAADRTVGTAFRLDDHCLAQLMAMTDRKLETFLKGF